MRPILRDSMSMSRKQRGFSFVGTGAWLVGSVGPLDVIFIW